MDYHSSKLDILVSIAHSYLATLISRLPSSYTYHHLPIPKITKLTKQNSTFFNPRLIPMDHHKTMILHRLTEPASAFKDHHDILKHHPSLRIPFPSPPSHPLHIIHLLLTHPKKNFNHQSIPPTHHAQNTNPNCLYFLRTSNPDCLV